MKWINQIPTDEVNVHIVRMKDIIEEIVFIVSNLLFYPILVYFYYVSLYYLIYFMKLIYCRNKINYKYNQYNFFI